MIFTSTKIFLQSLLNMYPLYLAFFTGAIIGITNAGWHVFMLAVRFIMFLFDMIIIFMMEFQVGEYQVHEWMEWLMGHIKSVLGFANIVVDINYIGSYLPSIISMYITFYLLCWMLNILFRNLPNFIVNFVGHTVPL